MSGRRRPRASRAEWVGFVAVLLVFGAAWAWAAHSPAIPVWLAGGLGFVAGILATVWWQRLVARTAYRFGYVKVRGRW
ncbi:hypothetical protein [Nonomuraea angiospora]